VNPQPHIRFETRERIGVITIEREERRNALNADLCDEMRALLGAHRDLLALVITGAGSAFCAGADLGTRFADGDAKHGGTDTFRPSFEKVLDAIVDHPAPVIAAINGAAIGAGMQLAVACDLRVASPSARMSIPGAKLGILLSATNIRRLTQLVGHGLARDFLLAAREVTGEEAMHLGLVQRVDSEPLVTALGLAADIAALAPLSVQGHKRALNIIEAAGAPGKPARTELAALEAAAFASEDLREGTAAFAEKRPPLFHGK
jgi:enoyl-CoA hydratase